MTKDKNFIVYGYFCTGKTTFCEKHKDITKDYDSEYMHFNEKLFGEFQKDITEGTDKILFINNYEHIKFKDISLIFILQNKEELQKRLEDRNTNRQFIKDIIKTFKTEKKVLKEFASINNIPLIELTDKEYITNYTEEIINRWKERTQQ